MEYNDGSVVLKVDKECVAITCDLKLVNQASGAASHLKKVCLPMSLGWFRSAVCMPVDGKRAHIAEGWIGGSNEDAPYSYMETIWVFPMTERM
jgi:hypothetical protein